MKSFYLALALLLTLPSFGQITTRKTFPFVDGDTLANKPASCVFPSFFQASDTGTLYQCYGGHYVIIATGTGPTTINGVTIGSESVISGFGFPSSIDILQNSVTHNFLTIRPSTAPTAGLYIQTGTTGNAFIGQNAPGVEGGGSVGWLVDGSIQIFPLASNPIISAFGHLQFNTDNTFDIGSTGALRPRTGYFGTSVITPSLQLTGATASLPVCTDGSKNLTTTGCPGGPGTAQTSGNIAVSGWGAGAAVSAVTGLGTRSTFTITAGTTPSVNPTIIVTYPVAQPATPVCMPRQDGGGTGITADMAIGTPSTTTSGTITWLQTPVNTSTYIFTVDCRL